jgi:hypothetical protein
MFEAPLAGNLMVVMLEVHLKVNIFGESPGYMFALPRRRRRQRFSPKLWYIHTRLNDVTSHKNWLVLLFANGMPVSSIVLEVNTYDKRLSV